MTDTAIFSSCYLAPVQYYCNCMHYNKNILDIHEHFIKQTYRSRCYIAAANGILFLSVPTEKYANNTPMCDIKIAYQEDWQRLHWKSIESAYKTSPFFDYYQDDLIPFFKKKYTFLYDLNAALHQKIMELLNLTEEVTYTTTFFSDRQDKTDLRGLHPKKKNDNYNFTEIPYYQVFEQKNGFIPNLSIIDLLFNMGNESRIILRKSWTN